MTPDTRPAVLDDEAVANITARYSDGVKLRLIQEEFDVSRSQIYWALEKSGVEPARVKRVSRHDDGDERTVERLYQVIEAQDQRIQQLQAELNAARQGG